MHKEQQIKNTVIYILPLLTGSILPFVSLAIFTRVLTKQDFGVFALAQIVGLFLSGVGNLGMTAAYDRNFFQYRHDPKKNAQLLYSVLSFVIFNFLVLAIGTYIFRQSISIFIIGSNEYGNLIFCVTIAQFLIGLNYYYLAYYKNSAMAGSYTVYTIGFSMINLVLSIVFVAILNVGVIGLAYAQFIAAAIIFFLFQVSFLSAIPMSLNKNLLLEMLHIAYPLTPRIFLGVISSQFDKYMIGLLESAGGVGIYAIGQRVANAIFLFMTAIQNTFSPKVYELMFETDDSAPAKIGSYLTPFIYSSIAVAILIALFSEEIMYILTPPSYHDAIDIVIVLSIFYTVLFFGKVNGNQLTFSKKTKITTGLSVLSLALNIGLNIPLITKFGAVGAAWGTLSAGAISGFISFIVSQRYFEIEWQYKKMLFFFLIFLTSASTLLVFRYFQVAYPIRLSMKIMTIGIFILSGIVFKIITKDNLRILKTLLTVRNKKNNARPV